MTEIYIFSKSDELLTILTESNGLLEAQFRDELNQTPSTPLTITVDAQVKYEQAYQEAQGGGLTQLTQVASMFIGAYGVGDVTDRVNVSAAQFVKAGNHVVFRDRENKLREYVIRELDDIHNIDGIETTAICLPAYVDELDDNYVLDKRYVDVKPNRAMADITDGTRYTGVIDGSFGNGHTNFYRKSSLESLYDMRNTWGGDITDEVILDEYGRISERKIILKQRLGADRGLRFEVDHNIEEIQRTVLSYPKTAMYGYGSSLEIEDEDGEATGGNTRYIDFGDVVWKKSNGDPADKPKGQTWIGDVDALAVNGIPDGDNMLHRYGKFSNQDYEEQEELLWATWNYLQETKLPEVNYQLSVDLLNKQAEMGDTAVAIDREFANPIEIQSRIIAIEYDLLDIEGTTIVEIGQFLNLKDDRLDKIEETIDENQGKWEKPVIDGDSFPDIKPSAPSNVSATGSFQTIKLSWDWVKELYVNRYEVYGSQVADFEPQEQQLIYSGDVSGFSHEVNTDETWYYYVRAVNTRGTAGEYSARVQAETVRVITDDILFGSITKDLIADLAIDAKKLANGAVVSSKVFDGAIGSSKLAELAVKTANIDDAAINSAKIAKLAVGTAAIQNLAVSRGKLETAVIGTAQIENGVITNAKIKDLAVDNAKIGNLSAVKITSGTLNADKVTIHGGSSIDYTKIKGSQLESRGKFRRTWRGSTRTHDIKMKLENGALRARNDSESWSLYFSDMGISTFSDGSGDGVIGEETTSGTLAFRDTKFYDSYGITMLSTYGIPAIESAHNKILLAPYSSSREGANYFTFQVKAGDDYRYTDGWIGFGETEVSTWGSGLRFSKQVGDPTIHATNRNGDMGTGDFTAKHIRASSIRTYNTESSFYIGTSSGEVRITNNLLYNGGDTVYRDLQAAHFRGDSIRSSKAETNFYIGTSSSEVRITNNALADSPITYRAIRASAFRESSSREIKKNIEAVSDKALRVINELNVMEYEMLDAEESEIGEKRVGLISEDSPEVATPDGEAIDLYKLISYNTKAIQELYEILEQHMKE